MFFCKRQMVTTQSGVNFILDVESAMGVQGEALLEAAHLSDHTLAVEVLKSSLQPGCALGTLLVLKIKPQLLVTRKLSLLEQSEVLPQSFSDVREAMVLPGYVAHIYTDAIMVGFLGSLEGKPKVVSAI